MEEPTYATESNPMPGVIRLDQFIEVASRAALQAAARGDLSPRLHGPIVIGIIYMPPGGLATAQPGAEPAVE